MRKSIQPNAEKHYLDRKYEDFNLWIDYWYQQKLLEGTKPQKILEVGKGTGTLELIMRKKGFNYTSLDIDKKLKPDIVGDIVKIPLKNNAFDTVCAFEVLEHIPFGEFAPALRELKRVSNKYIIISLPYACFYFGFAFQFFYTKALDFLFKFLRMKPFEPTYLNISIPLFFLDRKGMIRAHEWEMGRKNYSLGKIRKIIKEQGLSIERETDRIFYPYHRFFVLKKK